MKAFIPLLVLLLLVVPVNGQMSTKNSFCIDSQTLLVNATIVIDDGTGQPDIISITNQDLCPYGCQNMLDVTSSTPFPPGECRNSPLESSVVAGVFIFLLILAFIILTRWF